MPLSTDTLFHFSNLNAIKNILKSKLFWPVYNLERFTSELYTDHAYAIPMVCFCDLDFNLTSYHQKEYGTCSIGLKKSWAIKKKLNPVSYQLEQSTFTSATENLTQLLQMISERPTEKGLVGVDPNNILLNEVLNSQIKNAPQILHLLHKFLITIHAFKKPYQRKAVNYYDEREWRYVPEMYPDYFVEYENIKNKNVHRLVINEETYNNVSEKKALQDYLNKNFSLKFQENDVNLIIVESENSKTEIQDELKECYSYDFIKNNIKTYEEINLK